MKITEYKGKKLSNGLVAFNFYKKLTGRPLQADSLRISKIQLVQDKLSKNKINEISDADLKLMTETDFVEIVEGMYCAFRQAAEPELRRLDMIGLIEHDELTSKDLEDPAMLAALTELVGDDKSKK